MSVFGFWFMVHICVAIYFGFTVMSHSHNHVNLTSGDVRYWDVLKFDPKTKRPCDPLLTCTGYYNLASAPDTSLTTVVWSVDVSKFGDVQLDRLQVVYGGLMHNTNGVVGVDVLGSKVIGAGVAPVSHATDLAEGPDTALPFYYGDSTGKVGNIYPLVPPFVDEGAATLLWRDNRVVNGFTFDEEVRSVCYQSTWDLVRPVAGTCSDLGRLFVVVRMGHQYGMSRRMDCCVRLALFSK